MKYFAYILLFYSFHLLNPDFVLASPSKKKIDPQIKKIIERHLQKSGMNHSHVGIMVTSSENLEPLYELNSNRKFIPASLSKIMTAAAVLHYIPPGTKLKTKLMAIKKASAGVLDGDLYLVGGGDSGFVSESMWFLVNAFTRNNIKEIKGDLIVDDSYFDKVRFDESRESERVDRSFDAPVGAMSFNWNSTNIWLRSSSDDSDSAKALVFVDPENDYIKLKNNLKLGKKSHYTIERKFDSSAKQDTIDVNGSFEKGANEINVYKSINEPDLFAGANLIAFLKEKGIKVNGKVKSGVTPSNAQTLTSMDSKPIESLLADMNKFSINYVAEMLTKNMAALESPPGTLAKGVEMIRKNTLACGVPSEEFEIYNPSGFTRDNKFYPRALHKVLECLRKDFRVFPEFANSLPIAGTDGTLRNRMKNSAATRWVRAKTGLLDGVAGLAGYAAIPTGELYTFVLIYNGPTDGSTVRSTFDQIISDLVAAKQ